MSKNILFSHSYFLRFDPKQRKAGLPYPPLGTLYAAALMRKNGYQVALFDTMFSASPDEVTAHIQTMPPDFFVVYDDGFNYLTKMCLTNMREAALRMIRLAKEKGCTVIVSSSDSADRFEKYLSGGADFVLIGEAELTLLELTNAIQGGEKDFSAIPGLAYRENGATIRTPGRNVIKDLDSLPYPAWDLIEMDAYRQSWLSHAGYFSLNIATTRGCPFKCNWCAKPIYGNRYNARSPENVVEELKYLKKTYGFDHIWFCDDIFGLKPGWVNGFANIVVKENLRFKFRIQCRADLLLQENYIADLARAGCDNIWMGAESGSQKVLDAMDKGTTIPQIEEATRLQKKHGIRPSFFIQFGYPGETKEDIDKTIRMINKLLPYEIGISVSYPLPGTVFYEKVKDELKEKTNWTDSDDLQLMFKNSYPPAFYKRLHRYVHKNYHKHLAYESIKKLFASPFPKTGSRLRKAASLCYYLPATYLAKRRLDAVQTNLH